jgi:hypothetical protein
MEKVKGLEKYSKRNQNILISNFDEKNIKKRIKNDSK